MTDLKSKADEKVNGWVDKAATFVKTYWFRAVALAAVGGGGYWYFF